MRCSAEKPMTGSGFLQRPVLPVGAVSGSIVAPIARCLSRCCLALVALLAFCSLVPFGPRTALAQQPAAGGWQTGTTLDPRSAAPPPAAPGWNNPGNVTVVPRAAPEAAPGLGEITLSALLSDDGERIEQGLVWRIFQPVTPGPGAVLAKPRLVATHKEASPVLRLPPGDYLVNASFGRAHLTRKLTLAAGANAAEQFVLNAGGLRLSAALSNGEAIPASAVTFDVFAGEGDQIGARSKIIAGAKAGLIVRLNAGIYQVVSTFGDANATVRADVSVEAGKLSEAVITHQAARVTLKLVTRAGGEAIADTHWQVQTPQGETVKDMHGALPSHVLAAGRYVVVARNGGKSWRREFTVASGQPVHVEIVMN